MIGRLIQESVAMEFRRIALIPSVELIVDRLLIGIRLANNSGINQRFVDKDSRAD